MSLPAGKVASHLESAYGARVADVAELDRDVFRVERRDGPAWVVRVFPPERPVHAVEGDAEILRNLESAGFPAERRATGVSTLDGRGVLVTGFVDGIRPDRPGRTFAILGALLGRLHAQPAIEARPGGAWHHLAPVGVPADEIDAALTLLQSVRAGSGPRLVDAAVPRYRRHTQPTAEELERLAGVLPARALLIDCWSVAAGRRTPSEAVNNLRWARGQAERIAAHAVAAFTA